MFKLYLSILVLVLVGCTSSSTMYIPNYEGLGKPSVTLKGVVLKPKGNGPFPAVVIMHGCAGLTPVVNDALIKHTKFLNENGYVGIILDSFGPRNKNGQVCSSATELALARVYRKSDAYNTLRYLKTLPYIDVDNIFLMGQSNGGSTSLLVANNLQYPKIPDSLKFKAIVAFYPWCKVMPKNIRSPLLVMTGDKDDWTAIDTCANSQNRNMYQPFKVISYENAYHSFDLYIHKQKFMGYTVAGNKVARNDSRLQMLNWFERFRGQKLFEPILEF